jgi:hypothetical protein
MTDVTFYTCIESGRLEPEVVLMAATLRAFGGRFARCPVLAVRSRHGPQLARATLHALEQLDVRYVDAPQRHALDWLGFTCKPLAAEIADRTATTRHIVWLDGDIFVVREPAALDAPQYDNVEVLGCVEELGPVSTGEGDRFEPFWAALAQGARLSEVPFTTAGPSGKRIRLQINSGVFRFARGSGFAQRYRQTYDTLMALRVAPKDDPSIFLHEQILFSVAAASWPRGFALLAPEYNFHVEPMYEALYPPQRYGDAVLMHWHGALRMDDFAPLLRERLRVQLPALSAVVEKHLPLIEPPSLAPRLHRAALRRLRKQREGRFMQGVRLL